MYPKNFFDLFPPFPREPKVFVAMSFLPRYDPRWYEVIRPGILAAGLEPFRVDARKVSDSILTDIISRISNYELVFADISTMGTLEVGGRGYDVRNGNVLYEVGLAHAVRLPQEVILFRSDGDTLPFDVANIRVTSYDPDNDPAGAKGMVAEAIADARREIDLARNLAVRNVVDSLDPVSMDIVSSALIKQ